MGNLKHTAHVNVIYVIYGDLNYTIQVYTNAVETYKSMYVYLRSCINFVFTTQVFYLACAGLFHFKPILITELIFNLSSTPLSSCFSTLFCNEKIFRQYYELFLFCLFFLINTTYKIGNECYIFNHTSLNENSISLLF